MYQTFPQEDLPLNKGRFCQALGAAAPQGCSSSNPPPSPGIVVPGQAAYQPNGCGTSFPSNVFQSVVLSMIASNSYTNNINAPYPGISFRASCDAHDRCWAGGGERAACDNTFRQSTLGACEAVADAAGRNTCNGFSGAYHFAVATSNQGHAAYASSTAKRECALWSRDMRENDCED